MSKLAIDLRDDQAIAMNKIMPWGPGRKLWQAIVDDLLDLFKEHGPDLIIGLIINNRMKPREVLPSVGAAEVQAKQLARKGEPNG